MPNPLNTKAEPQVLIAGAGPTGLALALWLTRLGVGVRIIDKVAEAGTTSRALAVQARTLEFYQQLGIADLVVNEGVKVGGINIWAKGRHAARVPLENLGAEATPFPFPLVFPQDAHERLLIGQLEGLGVKIERRTELLRFEQDSAGVRATLRGPDGADQACEAAFLAGCDGARSITRATLGVGFPGGTYQGLFYVADVQAQGPVTNHELHVDLDESDLLLVFPMKGNGRVRLVGSIRETNGKTEGELTFADVSPRSIGHMKLQVERVEWFSTYKVHHRVADRFRDRRAFLLGDAAHIHSPAGGQGMNTGIGDAVNLAWKLAAVLRGESDMTLLDTYEPERIAFARRLVATTDRVFTLATRRGALARFVRTRLVPIVAPAIFRIKAARDFFFRTVSQIGVHYPTSTLNQGRAGRLKGGDRLPWTGKTPGEGNFAALTSLAWQVHVYGEVGPKVADVCGALNLPVHAFTWSARMQAAGLRRSALYLIRPDGYIALIEASGGADGLRGYLERRGLRPRRG
jgi:2-polyprenyl-6-methoxyphenol hydroxylase-like FAD-dependent oxidoreductase